MDKNNPPSFNGIGLVKAGYALTKKPKEIAQVMIKKDNCFFVTKLAVLCWSG